ncbi:MAG: DUF4743 domain-containing protein [Alphaproteobacteria bacterium]|nr:DUF4743 domain-containing protein [Alphaproteobacteria bacterium]
MTLKLIQDCNNAQPLLDAQNGELLKLVCHGRHVGYVRGDIAQLLSTDPVSNDFFVVDEGAGSLVMQADGMTADAITARLSAIQTILAEEKKLPKPAGELMAVKEHLPDETLFNIDRNLLFPLGVKSWGVHLVIRRQNGDFLIATRDPQKVKTFPGCYDVPVGGGLPAGTDPWTHVAVEADQEAKLPAELIRPTGEAKVLAYARDVRGPGVAKAYPFETNGGTNWDEVFYWEVTIPNDFNPFANDGEVERFQWMTPDQLLVSLRDNPEQWKTNSGVMLLQSLANDPRFAARFASQDHTDLQALTIADPRPIDQRPEWQAGQTVPFSGQNSDHIHG